MEKAENEMSIIEKNIDKHWNDSSIPDAEKREIILVSRNSVIYSIRAVTLYRVAMIR